MAFDFTPGVLEMNEYTDIDTITSTNIILILCLQRICGIYNADRPRGRLSSFE